MGTERGGVSGEKLNRQLCFQDPVLMAKEYLYPDKGLDYRLGVGQRLRILLNVNRYSGGT